MQFSVNKKNLLRGLVVAELPWILAFSRRPYSIG